MLQLKLAQLPSDNSDLSTELNDKDKNQLSQLNQNQMNSIYGGFDLGPAANQILGIVGNTAGQAITQGLRDLFS